MEARSRRRATIAGAGLLTAALVAASCSALDGGDPAPSVVQPPERVQRVEVPDHLDDREPVPTIPMSEDFVPPDTRHVSLPGVDPAAAADERDEQVPLHGGSAQLRVVVTDPGGRPVEGATVRIERFLADGRRGSVDRVSSSAGAVTLGGLRGGRYRVRAWRHPDLAATGSEAMFLSADEQASMRLEVDRFDDLHLQAQLTVAAWRVGDVATFEARVIREEVSAHDGRVRGAPQEDVDLVLSPGPGTAVQDDDEATTDAEGSATWRITCTHPGRHIVTLRWDDGSERIGLVTCASDRPRPERTDRDDRGGDDGDEDEDGDGDAGGEDS